MIISVTCTPLSGLELNSVLIGAGISDESDPRFAWHTYQKPAKKNRVDFWSVCHGYKTDSVVHKTRTRTMRRFSRSAMLAWLHCWYTLPLSHSVSNISCQSVDATIHVTLRLNRSNLTVQSYGADYSHTALCHLEGSAIHLNNCLYSVTSCVIIINIINKKI